MSDRSSRSTPRGERGVTEKASPLVIVLSGPSGAGKDAVLTRMKRSGRHLHYVVTATTRPKRAREKDGVDYHFISQKQFRQMVDGGNFLEWARVYGNYYGVPRDQISSALSQGIDTIVKVDVQGAAAIKKVMPEAVFIFLIPPSMEALERRLKRRRSESPQELALRLKKAREEMRSLPLFDYVVTSRQNRLNEVVSEIDAIIVTEKHRVKPRTVAV